MRRALFIFLEIFQYRRDFMKFPLNSCIMTTTEKLRPSNRKIQQFE